MCRQVPKSILPQQGQSIASPLDKIDFASSSVTCNLQRDAKWSKENEQD